MKTFSRALRWVGAGLLGVGAGVLGGLLGGLGILAGLAFGIGVLFVVYGVFAAHLEEDK